MLINFLMLGMYYNFNQVDYNLIGMKFSIFYGQRCSVRWVHSPSNISVCGYSVHEPVYLSMHVPQMLTGKERAFLHSILSCFYSDVMATLVKWGLSNCSLSIKYSYFTSLGFWNQYNQYNKSYWVKGPVKFFKMYFFMQCLV